ncbi:cytochrome P450 [Ktedonobacter robiniae]|uniref:Cytochrome P450 n=1 Tax=Ktedonobacter robiniae TaxID=2778365 RepID=A0ABQ3V6D1_9CHLR|nr:cytochrome P450 [Ktedonobacter robiniae]GHO60010.1 cytochrome P450 [Ktedonobacter robiniae]
MTQKNDEHLGVAYHPLQSEQLENPFPFYARLRNEEPITFSPEIGAWLVTRYQDVRAILAQPDVFSSRDLTRPLSALTPAALQILRQGYPMAPTAISSDGLNHQRFREPYVKALSVSRIASHEPYIRTVVHRLLDQLETSNSADFITQFAYPLTLEVILHVIGIPGEHMAKVKAWCEDLVDFLYADLTEERQVECAKGMVAFQHYIVRLIEDRRQNPHLDMISDLLHFQVSNQPPLSTHELVSAFCGFLMAGHRTTVDLLGNGMALLQQSREQWQALCEQPERIPTAIEEILRYDSPVQALYRTTTQSTHLAGVQLPAGTLLLLVFGSANRDEGQFPDAHVFNSQRTPNRHMAFGHGIHFCVGAPLARLEGSIAFEALTQRLPGIRLVEGQHLAHVPILAFRGYQKLHVTWP